MEEYKSACKKIQTKHQKRNDTRVQILHLYIR